MTANSHITVKQAAAAMNVSVRTVYEARRLIRSGHTDLADQVMAGTLSLHRALIMAGVKEERKAIPTLQAAWNSATDKERRAFVDWLEGVAA